MAAVLPALVFWAAFALVPPGLAAALAMFMFSLAGIPPLAGFFAKYYVFLAAIKSGLVALAIIGVVSLAFWALMVVDMNQSLRSRCGTS